MSVTIGTEPHHPAPTPNHPLSGMTILVVEDSRVASEAIRLLGLKSGARIRRADSLAAAHRHLAVYRPGIVITDIGLPDGSGAEIIAELAGARPLAPVLIGMSGDPGAEEIARNAGADAFLRKPVESLALFQQVILAQMPTDALPPGPRGLPNDVVAPDPVALAQDLRHAAEVLQSGAPGAERYVAQFLGAVARSAHDRDLEIAAGQVRQHNGRHRLSGLVEDRLAHLQAS